MPSQGRFSEPAVGGWYIVASAKVFHISLEPSRTAASALGPKGTDAFFPKSVGKTQDERRLGPITTSSTLFSTEKVRPVHPRHSELISTQCASCAIPALPGAHHNFSTSGDPEMVQHKGMFPSATPDDKYFHLTGT